jgi:hypothetical protein
LERQEYWKTRWLLRQAAARKSRQQAPHIKTLVFANQFRWEQVRSVVVLRCSRACVLLISTLTMLDPVKRCRYG